MQPSAVTSPREKCRVEAVRWPISNSATGEVGPWRWFTSWTEWCSATKSGWSSSRADKASGGSIGVRRGSVTQRAGRCPSGCLPYPFFLGIPRSPFFRAGDPHTPSAERGASLSFSPSEAPPAPPQFDCGGAEKRLVVTWAHGDSNRYFCIHWRR